MGSFSLNLRDKNTLLAAGLVALIYFNALNPGWQAHGVFGLDKVVHMLVYGLLATMILRTPCLKGNANAAFLAVVIATGLGFVDEALQSLSPLRHMDIWDAAADFVGAALAVMLYLKWERYRAFLEAPLPVQVDFKAREMQVGSKKIIW